MDIISAHISKYSTITAEIFDYFGVWCSWAGRKVIAMDSNIILDPDTPETGRYLRWEYDDSELCI